MNCTLHYVLFGLSKGLPHGIEAYSGIRDYSAMFYFLEN
jgi:hypothetical protein